MKFHPVVPHNDTNNLFFINPYLQEDPLYFSSSSEIRVMTFHHYYGFFFQKAFSFQSCMNYLAAEVHENFIVGSSSIFSSFPEMLLRRRKNLLMSGEPFIFSCQGKKQSQKEVADSKQTD